MLDHRLLPPSHASDGHNQQLWYNIPGITDTCIYRVQGQVSLSFAIGELNLCPTIRSSDGRSVNFCVLFDEFDLISV